MSRSQIGPLATAGGLDLCKLKLIAMSARLTACLRDWEPHSLNCEANLALNRLEWTSILTRQVSDALERIDKGTYGLCLQSGRPIAPKRLGSLPWTALCMTCQQTKPSDNAQ
jgi:Prokaryotic dksA/traR C4-type zinc finger